MSINARPVFSLTKSEIDRFWSKVAPTANPDKCWLWTGSKDSDGYGKLSITVSPNDDRPFGAHRIAYFLEHKSIDVDKLVMHSCDNPGCVNPKHLSLGTNKTNSIDRKIKGRGHVQVRGEAHLQSKLKDIDIVNIRLFIMNGESQISIANKYRVSRALIYKIQTKRRGGYII